MTENPDYWTTVATVIPVLALTLATVYRNNQWHTLTTFERRWSAAYGALLVVLLAAAEWQALDLLQRRTSDAVAERYSVAVVTVIAVQVIALPLLPLGVIALHDLNPHVVGTKRSLRRLEKKFRSTQATYDRVLRDSDRQVLELRVQATERILRDPRLAFDSVGRVRPDILETVPELRHARAMNALATESRSDLGEEINELARGIKKARRRHNKALMRRTKRASRLGHSRLM